MNKLVLEDNELYEVDMDCIARKEEDEKAVYANRKEIIKETSVKLAFSESIVLEKQS